MVKLKAPLMSLNARGRLSKLFSLARRQGLNIIERRPRPVDAKSPAQLFNRHMFTKCIDLWHLLSEAEKAEWEKLATPRHMTGYAWYISQCLRPNPGIYLPLQGGTMQGNIDMATNRILNLPDPTVNQEAATKKYHNDNKYSDAQADARIALHALIAAAHHAAFILADHTAIGDNAPHHARYTDAEANTRIAIHALIAAAHHARYADAEAVTAAKTVKLDDFATPDDNTDLNASAARHGLFKKLDGVVTHFLNGLGNWVAVVSGPTIATGTYTGDNSVNRAIPHGLGTTPAIALIAHSGSYAFFYRIYTGKAFIFYVHHTQSGDLAVTAMDATNFYVGNATDYQRAANEATRVYEWFTIG